jgi:PKHD-type hydroxylase
LFTDDELDKIIEISERQELVPGKTGGAGDGNISEIRVSKIAFVNYNPDTQWIYDKLNWVISTVNDRYYNFNLNGYSTYQYGTYDSDHAAQYNWHMDTFFGPIVEKFSAEHETRKLSLSLLLNDNFEGGEFQMNLGETPETIEFKKGRILLFPSFLTHRVARVTSGIRKSLVVWVTGPKFV